MYSYREARPRLFTETGSVMYNSIRDRVKLLLRESGAVRAIEAWKGTSGSTDDMMACLDRMVELGEIIECSPRGAWGQHRVFVWHDPQSGVP